MLRCTIPTEEMVTEPMTPILKDGIPPKATELLKILGAEYSGDDHVSVWFNFQPEFDQNKRGVIWWNGCRGDYDKTCKDIATTIPVLEFDSIDDLTDLLGESATLEDASNGLKTGKVYFPGGTSSRSINTSEWEEMMNGNEATEIQTAQFPLNYSTYYSIYGMHVHEHEQAQRAQYYSIGNDIYLALDNNNGEILLFKVEPQSISIDEQNKIAVIDNGNIAGIQFDDDIRPAGVNTSHLEKFLNDYYLPELLKLQEMMRTREADKKKSMSNLKNAKNDFQTALSKQTPTSPTEPRRPTFWKHREL